MNRPVLHAFESTAHADPWPIYEQVREAGEIVWDSSANAWLVSSHELVRQIALDDDVVWRGPFYPDPAYPPLGMDPHDWLELQGPSPRFLTFLEGESYNLQHRWFFRTLSPRVLRQWGDTLIEPIAHAQIDRFAGRGRADLAADFAERLSPRVMVAVMGLPWYDDEWLARIVELHRLRIAALQHQTATTPSRDAVVAGIEAVRELRETLMPYVLERRDAPGDDLISLIWRDAEELFGADFDEVDVVTTASQAFWAGSGTTAAGIGNAIYLLLSQPGLEDRVRAGGMNAVQGLLEETLRLYSPVEFRPRRAKERTTLGGVTIEAGDRVVALSAAASRDPAHYPAPEDVRLDRTAPRDHYGFFKGPRTCPGQSLARFELEAALFVLLARLRDLRPDPGAPAAAYSGVLVRRWQPLHALFDA